MPTDDNPGIERHIVIGMIVSTDYLKQIRLAWNTKFLESTTAQRIAGWCIEYFDKYEKAPFTNIEGIFLDKLRKGQIPEDIAEEIEQNILGSLSESYDPDKFNVNYLLDQTFQYFSERHLLQFGSEIQSLVESGELLEAEQLVGNYKAVTGGIGEGLDLASDLALERVMATFSATSKPVIRYPKELGKFWNDQLVRGGFVALLASEKRGKSFLLLDLAMRGVTQKANVAFFQAGDMTESQQLRRIAIYVARKPVKEKYCGRLYLPVRDCIYNQLDTCDKAERECNFGIFEDVSEWTAETLRTDITFDVLKERFLKEPDYVPCYNCSEYSNKPWGTPWFKTEDINQPLDLEETKEIWTKFFIDNDRHFRLSTHAQTLSVSQIRTILDIWEKQYDFIADIVIIDYADLLEVDPSVRIAEYRHKQNHIWRGMRRLSEERDCLVVTATQADAQSYTQNSLKLSNFSEDKRKYSHVTASYGLNQDPGGREKKLGILRLNELVVREDDFSISNEIRVLQRLQIGRPYLGAFR